MDRVMPAACALALVGCGRIAFDPQVDAPADTSADANVCAGPFGTPDIIPSLDSNLTEATFHLTADELTGVFWSARGGNIDLYLATRTTLLDPFVVTPLTALNTADAEFGPAIAPDGSFLLFSSTRPGGLGSNDLYESSFVAGTGFTAPVHVDALASANVEDQAYIVGDQVYFMSDRSGRSEIYQTTRLGPGNYSAPVELTELSSGTNENDPVVAPDQLRIYWGSKRTNGGDIYTASRATTLDPFGAITVVAELATSAVDAPSFISLDGCRLYMSSDRAGMPHIYVATR